MAQGDYRLVDESYVVSKLKEFDDYRLKFYCHHVTYYGTDNGTYTFSFDVIVPNVKKTLSDLWDFMYNKNIVVPCSGIRNNDNTLVSCFYAKALKSNDDSSAIYTWWRHINSKSNDVSIYTPISSSGFQLVVWEI